MAKEKVSRLAGRYHRLEVEQQADGRYRWVFLVRGKEDEVIARSTDVLETQDEAVLHARSALHKTAWSTLFVTKPMTGETFYDEDTFIIEIEQNNQGRWRFRGIAIREEGEPDTVLTGTDTYRSPEKAREAAEMVIEARSHDTIIRRVGGEEEKV